MITQNSTRLTDVMDWPKYSDFVVAKWVAQVRYEVASNNRAGSTASGKCSSRFPTLHRSRKKTAAQALAHAALPSCLSFATATNDFKCSQVAVEPYHSGKGHAQFATLNYTAQLT